MKYDWYQTDSYVTLSVVAKNKKAEDVQVDIAEQRLTVSIKDGDSTDTLELSLWQAIKPQESSFKLLSTKIEIKLIKNSAEKWPSIERKQETNPKAPVKTKNWDKIAADVEEEKAEGDQALNELFQKLYSDADENTRRAMNKSYMESGGTVLSTNWNEVGSKRVDVKPPDGMEYKQFEK